MPKIPVAIFTLIILTALPALAEPMTFRRGWSGGNCNGCEWIAAQGEIMPDTPARFREYIAENGKPYYITLHSLGGDLGAGIELGQTIRKHGATTMIGRTVQVTEE